MRVVERGRAVPVAVLLAVAIMTVFMLGVAGCSDEEAGDPGTTTTVAGGGEDETTTISPPSTFTTTRKPGDGEQTTPVTEPPKATVEGKSQEEYEQALPELQKKVAASPEDLALLEQLAVAQFQTGRYEDAAKTYEKMLGIEDSPRTRNNYANVLRDWGRKGQAKEQYEKALAAEPTLTVTYINLANVWYYEGDKAKALEILDRGIAATAGEEKARLTEVKKALAEKK